MADDVTVNAQKPQPDHKPASPPGSAPDMAELDLDNLDLELRELEESVAPLALAVT